MNTTAASNQSRSLVCRTLLNNVLDSVTNSTIYGAVTYTGTARRVRLFVIVNGHLQEITYTAAVGHGFSLNDKGILVRGTGFCAVQHLVEKINVRITLAKHFDAQSLGGAL